MSKPIRQEGDNRHYYADSHPALRGASSGDVSQDGAGCGARGRIRNPLPGGPGQAVRRHYRPAALNGWTRRGRRGAEALRIRGPRGPRPRPEARRRGQKSRTWSAAGRARLSPRRARASQSADQVVAPRGAPSPRDFSGERLPRCAGTGKTGEPGASTNNTGDGACPGLGRIPWMPSGLAPSGDEPGAGHPRLTQRHGRGEDVDGRDKRAKKAFGLSPGDDG
jgi:hypothetical protein